MFQAGIVSRSTNGFQRDKKDLFRSECCPPDVACRAVFKERLENYRRVAADNELFTVGLHRSLEVCCSSGIVRYVHLLCARPIQVLDALVNHRLNRLADGHHRHSSEAMSHLKRYRMNDLRAH